MNDELPNTDQVTPINGGLPGATGPVIPITDVYEEPVGPTGFAGFGPKRKKYVGHLQPTFSRGTIAKRNAPCPCGSGMKFKKCCLGKVKLLASMPANMRQEMVVNAILGKK